MRGVELLNAANKAFIDMFGSVGFQQMLSNEKRRRKTAAAARAGNSDKAIRWREKVPQLAEALWEKKPDYRANASSTAGKIINELTTFCESLSVKAPKEGTVAKFISGLKDTTR